MAQDNDIVIVDAIRTAVGNFSGGLASVSAAQLGANVISALVSRNKLAANDVSEVLMGQVLTAGVGQNPARQSVILSGLSESTPAMTLNQVCGSGLRAVAEAYKSILVGDNSIVIAGGQENMSASPHSIYMRGGVKMGNGTLSDTMVNDGLWDSFNNYHMGITAENIAAQFGITREEQDAFAAASQAKAVAAQAAGRFKDEIIPVIIKDKKGDKIVDSDEFIRADTTAESLAKLRPAFKPDCGTVTAGNASGINDGAAAVLLMTREEAIARGLKPLARIASWATAGVDPKIMGTGPIPASQLALKKAGWTHDQLDLIEANEAFAAQAISVNRGMEWDVNKVNVNGGAIAIGHPIGASGARILVSLLHEMQRRDAKKALATLCIGGGMGIALCVEKA